jgi:hypothetical protein
MVKRVSIPALVEDYPASIRDLEEMCDAWHKADAWLRRYVDVEAD